MYCLYSQISRLQVTTLVARQSGLLQELVANVRTNYQNKPNAGLTDQLHKKILLLSAKIRIIEAKLLDYATIFRKSTMECT